MLKVTRREFLAATSALLLDRSAAAMQAPAAVPPRLARKDCYFGLHFDLHPNAKDTELGRDLTDAMVSHLLQTCRPDFIQYDSKGHPGYLGFPSKTGMSAPGIVHDSLAVWRRVTAAHGVALYNHFSGVLDGFAVTKHPDWARVDPDGKRDAQETSLFGSYDRELMIPELIEAALNYDLDGSWVDGECWAVQPDYCNASKQKFLEKTGIAVLPRKPEDKGWNKFLELQREQFRQHVAQYVEALHRAKPGYQITSNWIYSTLVPERPAIPVNYLSGDFGFATAARMARVQARYLSRCGKPWDLMSWGFELDDKFGNMSDKPAVELEQEAAIVLSQGGAYQIYYVPTRAGWIDGREIETAAKVAEFCRRRQRWSHRSESLPEVGGVVLRPYSVSHRGPRLRIMGHGRGSRHAGAVDLLLSCGYSVDLIPDWQLAETAAQYPLLVLPDWKDIGDEVAGALAAYVAGGGKLLACGAENALRFSSVFGLHITGAAQERAWFVADESGFAQVSGSWMEIDAPEPQIVAHAYRTHDTRKDTLPLAVTVSHGMGTAVICPAPLASVYGNDSTPILRSIVRSIVAPLYTPMVTVDGDFPELQIVIRKKDGQILIHLINAAGTPVTTQFRHTGVVPPTGPIRFRIRLQAAPSAVVLEPDGAQLAGEYLAGEWRGVLPDLHIHAILRIAPGA